MTLETAIRCIGASHVLQPPMTLLLARRLGLRRAFSELPPLATQVAHNMAFASVFLPTFGGLLIAWSAHDVACGAAIRHLAWLLAAFWTWRLSRQIAIRSLLPAAWHWGLSVIFWIQGPLFAIVLLQAPPTTVGSTLAPARPTATDFQQPTVGSVREPK
jgi:hypothetical protein